MSVKRQFSQQNVVRLVSAVSSLCIPRFTSKLVRFSSSFRGKSVGQFKCYFCCCHPLILHAGDRAALEPILSCLFLFPCPSFQLQTGASWHLGPGDRGIHPASPHHPAHDTHCFRGLHLGGKKGWVGSSDEDEHSAHPSHLPHVPSITCPDNPHRLLPRACGLSSAASFL